MDKLNKLSLPAVIIIASLILGGFYYMSQVNKTKSIERQQEIKIEQEKQDQLKEQQAKEEAERALNTCIGNADSNYKDDWYNECKAQGKLTSKCIEIKELSFADYLRKYNLSREEYKAQRSITDDDIFAEFFDYTKRQDECSCGLLVSTAERLEERLEKNKAECIKRYPPK